MGIIPNKRPASESDFLGAALAYMVRGWSTIPNIGKRSAHHWKQFQHGPADEATLRRMFMRK